MEPGHTPPEQRERILVIEDERPMRVGLMDALAREGYRVLAAEDGERGLARALDERPDLILLDVMMPKLDGFALCRELRRLELPIPILMLTAKALVQDRVHGLDAGADDYLVKPFSTEELIARVRALLRRFRRQSAPLSELDFDGVRVNFVTQTVERDGQPVRLTAREFSMLRLLAENAGRPVSREKFLDVVWGYAAFPTTRTVDNHIASLRAKLETTSDPRWIQTVHGVGYKLVADRSILQNHDKPGAPT